MNKYRKAESRKVKAYVRLLCELGYNPSYKKARRRIRKYARAMRDLSTNVRRGLNKGIKRCDYEISKAVRDISAQAGMRVHTFIIDEMHSLK